MKRTYIYPSGPPNATIAIVGEQPGVEEIRGRPPKPFIGPAGRMLDECLSMTKLIRRELYITNVIKDLDAPLKHYIDISKTNPAIHPEGQQYINELREELSNLNLNCVIAMGNIALFALTSRKGITKWRGSVLESTIIPGLKVIPTFHPATVIPPKMNFLNKPLICEDLLRAKNESETKSINTLPRTIITAPTFDHACSYLKNLAEIGRRGQTIGIDIEVINRELDCISFCADPSESISIPFRYARGDYFTVDQEYEIMLLIAAIIQDPKIAKVGANFIFDMQFLFHKYGIVPRGTLHCTQIAQKIACPDYPAGLDFVTNMHTDIPYYKADGKQWMKMGTGSWEEWWNYNGMDGIVPVEANPKQQQLLRKQGNEATYERQRRLIKPLIYMSERGIKINTTGMVEYKGEQEKELEKFTEKLYGEVGYEINYNSPKQLMNYFYIELGNKPYKKRNAHGKYVDTIDVNALKRLSRRNIPAAQTMLDIRSLTKRLSTYLNIRKVDEDGRYRSSYKPVGAETGRLASGETIFGTGGNQQNWPHDLLRFFCFDEGYLGYSIDLSQIENRIVAHVGGVISQIKAFRDGVDLHRLTASIIFNKPYDQISGEDGSASIGDGRQSERFWGKKGNHAINYDVGYKTFALVNEIPEAEAKRLIETIHRGYPQIRGGYQLIIQEMLKANRTVTNLFGRNRLFLGPIIPSHPFVPKSSCIATYREAYAHLPQSTCADKINEQGIEFIYYNQKLFKHVELLSQVHDSVVFQIPLTLSWEEHAKILLMIKASLETPLWWRETEITTPADICIGLNMSKKGMVELKSKEIPTNPAIFAEKIKGIYDEIS